MTSTKALIARWKAFARRSAQIQSAAILWVLYYVLLVPIALVRRRGTHHQQTPSWQTRNTRTADLASARRQF